LVAPGPTGHNYLRYNGIVAALVGCVKELSARVSTLEGR
jgi:hypothetical protein